MGNLYFIPVEGTGSPGPYDWGFPQNIAFELENPWNNIYAQFMGSEVGNIYTVIRPSYPAQTFPMGPSVQVGRQNVGAIIRGLPQGSKVVLSGYSQGALVTDYVMLDFLSGAFPGVTPLKVYNFGDPMRCPGICLGNEIAGFGPLGDFEGVPTGGIAGIHDLTPDQSKLIVSCNNRGDLYGDCPVGANPWTAITATGADEQLIFDLIQNFDGQNITAFVTKALTLLGLAPTMFNLFEIIKLVGAVIEGMGGPSVGIPGLGLDGAKTQDQVVALVLALLNGGMFVMRGFGPHGDYDKYVPAMVDDCLKVGRANYSLAA